MTTLEQNNTIKIGIIGLGYVGLPLAIEFSKKYSVIGLDKDANRIKQLNDGIDKTLEVNNKTEAEDLKPKLYPDLTNCIPSAPPLQFNEFI